MTVSQFPDDWRGLPEETKPAPTPTPDFYTVSDTAIIPPQSDTIPRATIEPTSGLKPNKAEKLEQQRTRMAMARDDPTFTAFCKEYERNLYSFILNLTEGNTQDTEDIRIETFVAAALEWYKIRTWEEKPRRSWLYKTAGNKVTDHYRRLNARSRLLKRLVEEHQVQERSRDLPENERVWLLMEKLSKKERASLVLLSQGFSISEIAEVFNVAESSVRGYLTRGRQKYMRAAEQM